MNFKLDSIEMLAERVVFSANFSTQSNHSRLQEANSRHLCKVSEIGFFGFSHSFRGTGVWPLKTFFCVYKKTCMKSSQSCENEPFPCHKSNSNILCIFCLYCVFMGRLESMHMLNNRTTQLRLKRKRSVRELYCISRPESVCELRPNTNERAGWSEHAN